MDSDEEWEEEEPGESLSHSEGVKDAVFVFKLYLFILFAYMLLYCNAHENVNQVA